MEDQPLVHIIVLNYNGRENEHLEYCLPSILATDYENLELVLVDNDSGDDSLQYVKDNFPEVTVLPLDENRGWAGGNNAGIEYSIEAGAEYVLLANNDIRVHPQWISAAVSAAESDPAVGFVGFDVHGRVKPIPIEEWEAACEAWEETEYDYTEDHIDGLALFARVDLFSEVGSIDENYFAYGEEIDLEKRGAAAGYRRMRTNVPIWHYSSGTFGTVPLMASYLAIRNQIRLAIKHEGVGGVVQRVLALYNTACNPFLDFDADSKVVNRRRPRNIFFNFFIVTYCLLWNLVYLRSTLRRRREDYAKVRESDAGSETDRD